MNILLFGGSFNPPHLGHLLVIQQAFEIINDIDELWLLPTYQHTFQKALAPADTRLELCRLLIQELNDPKVKLSTFEIDHKLSGSTYETIRLLKQNPEFLTVNPNYSFLIGSDQLPVFTKWHSWEKLLQEIPFYVYPRAGYPMTPLYPNMHPPYIRHPSYHQHLFDSYSKASY